MERLTDREIECMTEFCEATGCVNYECEGCISYQRYQRLAHYEDLEEQGRLVVMPCNIGDELWLNYEGKAHRMRVQGVSVSARGNDTILHFGGYPIATAWGSDLGKTVFLSRPEAEAALAASGKEG